MTGGGPGDPFPAVFVKACSSAVWSSSLSLLGARGPKEGEEGVLVVGRGGRRQLGPLRLFRASCGSFPGSPLASW